MTKTKTKRTRGLASSGGGGRSQVLFLFLALTLLCWVTANAFVVVPLTAVKNGPSFAALSFWMDHPPTSTTHQHRPQPIKLHSVSSSHSTRLFSSSRRSASTDSATNLVGDDSAFFDLNQQSISEWIKFSVATGTVLAICAWAWVLPDGPLWGNAFLEWIQTVAHTTDPAVTVFAMLTAFAVAHSGLAGLRTYAEPIVGARAWRVLFAVVSLPLALSCISYFVNHAHEGIQLWTLPAEYAAQTHLVLWWANFVSFLFLYPSTFNLLEIAAIQRPQLHLWETGVIRITRHPQAVGQLLWCLAHTAYLGSSTAVAASAALIAHHAFSVYHGDRRLETRHGEAFEYIKAKTSVVPFQAILEGRQELPDDYYKEFLRLPYAFVVVGTVGAYLAHPYMQAGAALLGW